jgi:hypothetical protein
MTLRRLFSKPAVQRSCILILSALVLGYLTIITYTRFDELDTPEHFVLTGTLWTLGIVGLLLLARAWRQISWSHH